jgi:hypothetical protein
MIERKLICNPIYVGLAMKLSTRGKQFFTEASDDP